MLSKEKKYWCCVHNWCCELIHSTTHGLRGVWGAYIIPQGQLVNYRSSEDHSILMGGKDNISTKHVFVKVFSTKAVPKNEPRWERGSCRGGERAVTIEVSMQTLTPSELTVWYSRPQFGCEDCACWQPSLDRHPPSGDRRPQRDRAAQ